MEYSGEELVFRYKIMNAELETREGISERNNYNSIFNTAVKNQAWYVPYRHPYNCVFTAKLIAQGVNIS